MDVAILNPLKALKVRYHFGFGVSSLAAQNGSQYAVIVFSANSGHLFSPHLA